MGTEDTPRPITADGRSTPELDAQGGLTKLADYPYQIASWVDDAGYPVSVAIDAFVDPEAGSATFAMPAGLTVPTDRDISLTGSHIRPQPGYGYDERRHVTVWGRATAGDHAVTVTGRSAWGWDEAEVPFFEYSERSAPQSRKYFDALSAERGTPVKPRLSFGFLALRTTRLPFLTATIIPVLLGILIAASHGAFDLAAAALTVIGAAFVQLGLNVANDVFDTVQGADDANVTPTQFSGGSRVIQYGLVSLRQMAGLATVFYVLAGIIGLILLATHGSPALLVIGVVGFIVSIGYTAPPLKFVYRGLGEIAVALGFGPMMLLGAYVVQTGGALSWEPFVASIPVALLVALILYVNEIPDRRGDARAGKRTLPVRFSPRAVITGYNVAAAAAYVALVIGVVVGVLPIPTLLMLLTIPLALQVSRGLAPNYDNPYGLMAIMGVNVKLHLAAGVALLVGYLIVLIVGAVLPGASLFLGSLGLG
jgi:1,4-dihydroxy-2-naphthoate octaprenyltransferase